MDNAIGGIQNALREEQIRPRIFPCLRKLSRMYNGFDLTCKLQHHCKKPPQVRLPYKARAKRMTVDKDTIKFVHLARVFNVQMGKAHLREHTTFPTAANKPPGPEQAKKSESS